MVGQVTIAITTYENNTKSKANIHVIVKLQRDYVKLQGYLSEQLISNYEKGSFHHEVVFELRIALVWRTIRVSMYWLVLFTQIN